MEQPQQQQPSLELDDEFEEFDVEDWNPKKANPTNAALWQVDWDTDDAQTDDFAKQLVQELERAKQVAKQ